MKKILTQFKRWMDYNPPGALTSKGWRLFSDEFKKNAPIRYWFKNNFRHAIILPIRWKWESMTDFIRYRTFDKYHVVKTGLKPGYQTNENILLHSSFNILKDFVEVELAFRTYVWTDEGQATYRLRRYLPFYKWITLYTFRSRKYGLEHLNWASGLDDPSLPLHERCDHQAKDAREILALYHWLADVYPNRKKEESELYSDQGLGHLSILDSDFDRNAADYVRYNEISKRNDKLEEDWDEEDTQMYIRLVKIRKTLWV